MSQFFHIHLQNPQQRLIRQAVQLLDDGGVMIYPTDSGYALGCKMGDKHALDRILQIRKIDSDHNFSLVCSDLSQLSNFARVDNSAFRLLKNNTPGAYTFIFKGTKEVPKRLLNDKKKTIGIRVPDHPISQALVAELGEPLMSCSLVLPDDHTDLQDPDEIMQRLGKLVDVIVNGGYVLQDPTTVIDFSNDSIEVLRVGAGDPEPFLG